METIDHKKFVRDQKEVGMYGVTVEDQLQRIQKLANELREAGWINLNLSVEENQWSEGYDLCVTGFRPRTENEIKILERDEIQLKEMRRQQFEQLKEEFGV